MLQHTWSCVVATQQSTRRHALHTSRAPPQSQLRFALLGTKQSRAQTKGPDPDFMRSSKATHAGSTLHGSYTAQSLGPRPGVSSAAAAECAVLIVPHARRALRRTSTQALVNTQTHPYFVKSPQPLIMVGKSEGQLRPNPAHMITAYTRDACASNSSSSGGGAARVLPAAGTQKEAWEHLKASSTYNTCLR